MPRAMGGWPWPHRQTGPAGKKTGLQPRCACLGTCHTLPFAWHVHGTPAPCAIRATRATRSLAPTTCAGTLFRHGRVRVRRGRASGRRERKDRTYRTRQQGQDKTKIELTCAWRVRAPQPFSRTVTQLLSLERGATRAFCATCAGTGTLFRLAHLHTVPSPGLPPLLAAEAAA